MTGSHCLSPAIQQWKDNVNLVNMFVERNIGTRINVQYDTSNWILLARVSFVCYYLSKLGFENV